MTAQPASDQRPGRQGLAGTRVDRADLIALRGPARRLSLHPRVRLPATGAGCHLTHFRGRGMEFDETRQYQPGDDVRQMDWQVTARSGQPHIKLFREERERPVWLWIDQGPSMRFGTRVAFKSVRAAEAAALLAWAAVDGGDHLGALICAGDRLRELRPRSRHPAALRLLDVLAGAEPDGGQLSSCDPLNRLVQVVRPGSLVFLLSDFATLEHRHQLLLAHLAAHSEVATVLVYDPLEAEPLPPGRWPISDGRQTVSLYSGSRHPADLHRQRFQQRRQQLQELAKRHRMHCFQLGTDRGALGQLEQAL